MTNFGEQQPTSPNRERLDKNEEGSEDIKKQLADAMASEDYGKVAELGGQMKSLKGQKEEFLDKDREEADVENTERKNYDEAKAEDTERTATKEAEKAEAEKVAKEKAAKELEEASENLKKQLAEAIKSGDNDKIIELGGQMKELTDKRNEIAGPKDEKKEEEDAKAKEFEKLKSDEEEASAKKLEEVRKKINGEAVKNEDSPKSEVVEKTENAFEQIKVQYNNVLDKIKIAQEKLQELEEQRKELADEKRKIEGTGDKQKLDEINEKLKEGLEQRKKIIEGEKRDEIRHQYDDQQQALSEQIKQLREKNYQISKTAGRPESREFSAEEMENSKQIDVKSIEKEKIKINYEESLKALPFEDCGLEGAQYEASRLIGEFKKQNGYDKSLIAEEKKLGYGSGETDANRKFMNDYFGTEMPIFSKDFKLGKKFKNKEGAELPYVIADNSKEGIYNQSLLAKKQVELWQRATEAMNEVGKISKDTIRELIKEHKLEYDAIMGSSCVEDIYQPFLEVTRDAGQNTGKSAAIIRPDAKFYPEDVKKYADSGYELTQKGIANERWIKSVLFVQKMAKEKGLIG